MILAALVLAALFLRAQVFPEPLCENLPEVSPEVKTWVAEVAPELAQVPVRELSEKTALDVFRRAAVAGWGGHRRPHRRCVPGAVHLPSLPRGAPRRRRGLRLGPPDRHPGTGQARAGFRDGRHPRRPREALRLHDRDGIVYRNETLDRDFKLASRVEFDTPAAGVLENIHGLCAKVWLFGCVRVRSMVKDGETVEVRAGAFASKSPLKPIQTRGEAGHPGR